LDPSKPDRIEIALKRLLVCADDFNLRDKTNPIRKNKNTEGVRD
jgi:hypothetical protein